MTEPLIVRLRAAATDPDDWQPDLCEEAATRIAELETSLGIIRGAVRSVLGRDPDATAPAAPPGEAGA